MKCKRSYEFRETDLCITIKVLQQHQRVLDIENKLIMYEIIQGEKRQGLAVVGLQNMLQAPVTQQHTKIGNPAYEAMYLMRSLIGRGVTSQRAKASVLSLQAFSAF